MLSVKQIENHLNVLKKNREIMDWEGHHGTILECPYFLVYSIKGQRFIFLQPVINNLDYINKRIHNF